MQVINIALFLFSSFPLVVHDKQEPTHRAEMDAAVDLLIAERRYLPRGVLLRILMTSLIQPHRSTS